MAGVQFQDFSMNVKAVLDDSTIAWLHTWASEIESQAKANVSSGDWSNAERTQLRGSYANVVDESKGEAQIGSPLEQAFWEEFGTGSHAAVGKSGKPGRPGWWVYIKDQPSQGGGKSYKSREEAEEAAEFLRKVKKVEAYATNGRDPNATLEKAFLSVKDKARKDLEDILKAGLGK